MRSEELEHVVLFRVVVGGQIFGKQQLAFGTLRDGVWILSRDGVYNMFMANKETIHNGEKIRFQKRGRVFEGVVQGVQESRGNLHIQVEYEDFRHLFSKTKVTKITWIQAEQVL